MVILWTFPVALSCALTLTIPLASISNVTSIWGTPLAAGAIPSRLNSPRSLLSTAICLSPCETLMVTADWLSSAVEKVWDFFVGIVVFLSINLVKTPPKVSIPRERGVTSKSKTSFTSPVRTPPWIAAPEATTSSGFTPLWGSALKNSVTVLMIFGILVIPPTKITSSISPAFIPASFRASLHGFILLVIRSSTRLSNCALDNFKLRCFGPDASAVINGKLTSVWAELDSSILAFSAASFILWRASLSSLRSMPESFLNSSAKWSMILWSKSSPPRNVSPLVDLTSKTPSPTSKIDTSKVPPPKS